MGIQTASGGINKLCRRVQDLIIFTFAYTISFSFLLVGPKLLPPAGFIGSKSTAEGRGQK